MSSAPAQGADELKIARALTYGIPALTLVSAGVALVVLGAATSILVLAAGLLLGVIAILWASLRILSGDAPLSPELEALEMSTQGVDALAGRKTMLLRALKDLNHERSIGKIDPDDYEQLSQNYRRELKVVFRRIDESLAPHRARAEEALRAHMEKAGLAPSDDVVDDEPSAKDVVTRTDCPKCGASNEIDAKFCKECAAHLKVSEPAGRRRASEEGSGSASEPPRGTDE